MTPDQFQIVTALTIGSIGAILLLYLIVLKKKGWLTEEKASPEASYLCPNPECRKIFEKPITLTDLSTNPPRSYLACPHCGLDLQKIPAMRKERSKTDDEVLPSKKPQRTNDSPTVRIESSKLEAPTEMKITEKREASKPAFLANAFKGLRKHTESSDSKLQVQTSSKRADKPKQPAEEKVSERPRACSHHFGYVKTLPKNTSIPDDCLWCPWIVDCLAGEKKVEA